jgi:rare lipoprotein A
MIAWLDCKPTSNRSPQVGLASSKTEVERKGAASGKALVEHTQRRSVVDDQQFELTSATQYRFYSKDMNQHRWTCLVTVVLTTVIGPITSVHANTRSFSSANGASHIPVSPQSLPTITTLVVTELETDLVTPTQVTPVPLVSKLPIVKVITNRSKSSARSTWLSRRESKKDRVAKLKTQPAVAKLPPVNPIFSSTIRVTDPTFPIANPTSSVAAIVSPVFPLPLPSTAPVLKAPTPIEPIPSIATIGTVDKIQVNSTPQFAPIIRDIKDTLGQTPIQGPDLPMFEAGVPNGINKDKTSQIVVTAIAQVGDTIVAPEPSIAIPIQQPNQPKTPSKLPASVPPTAKIDQPADPVQPALDKIVATQSGQASWYGMEGGPQTASGERYNPSGLTAAHRTLPFGTKVRVTSLKTGKTVIVRINDRGPVSRRRIIDVSAGAAEAIGIKNDGIGEVRMDILDREG